MSKQNPKAGPVQMKQDIDSSQKDQVVDTQKSNTAAPAVSTENQSNESVNLLLGSEFPADSANTEESKPVAPVSEDLVVAPVVITPPAAAPVAKVVVVDTTAPVIANASLKDHLDLILKDVPKAFQIDINRIMSYVENMHVNRPINPVAGAKEQLALYRSIQSIINRHSEYFTQLFSAVLAIFKAEQNGVMGDRYRLRFMESIPLPQDDRKAFVNLTTMMAILADPQSRDVAMPQVNMGKSLENGLTAEGRDRVLNYFGV